MMAGKHRKTYDALQSNPVRANISWNDVVALLAAAGCTVKGLTGSIFEFKLGNEKLLIHRPHPGKELSKGRVRSVREFLELLRINPDDL
jgi:HicA toxin of bacterial toxin-antitoxin,